MKQPIVPKIPKTLEIHGDTRVDDYYWLNDRNNPEVIAYLNAENAYRKAKMAHTEDFQKKLFDEIVGRIQQTDMSVPYKSNHYFYYSRFEAGKEYPYQCRKKDSLENAEEIFLDIPNLAKGHPYYAVGGMSVSPDNEQLCYGVDTVSRRLYTLCFKNLKTGAVAPTQIPNTTGGTVWSADNKTIFYTQKDTESLRSCRIYRHTIGTDPANDVLIFEEKDETFNTFVTKTKSKKYIVIGSSSTVSTEYQILEADNPTGNFRIIQPRERDLEYAIAHYENDFYIVTNYQAKNFRLMKCNADGNTHKENWIEVIPHRTDVLLEDIDIFKHFLVVSERKEGITRLQIRAWDGSEEHYIDFGESAYMAYTSTNPDFDTAILRLGYTSLTRPNSVFDYNMQTRKLHLLKQEAVLDANFKTENYASERIYATAKDGVLVPISLVYNKKYPKNKKNALLLYAYGSYGHSMDPYFSSPRLSLLDRGFTYAIAHIRGGQEMGRHWYEDGKLLKKKNTFTDFIDCAEHLIANGYTSNNKLTAMGGSAGGLLMGAILNMRPDLWKGVVAAVPFVDVVTTMLDETIPLTTGEFDEWGNPKKKEYYEYIKSYSPYDNVEKKAYPALLITTGLHDSQVQYWEPAKWIAKLRTHRTNRKPLYMYCNMETGHGGASGRFERYKEVAMEYAFLLDLFKITE
jgi:oligopeptidase B